MPHWKSFFNPQYLGAYSFEDDKDIIATIKNAGQEKVVGEGGKASEKLVIHFRENIKPMVCNATNSKTISMLCKSTKTEKWPGLRIQLYVDHNVKFAGEIRDGIRVRPFHPKIEQDKPIKCTECKKDITAYGKMSAAQIAEHTTKKYGKPLCDKCAAKIAEQHKGNDVL